MYVFTNNDCKHIFQYQLPHVFSSLPTMSVSSASPIPADAAFPSLCELFPWPIITNE